MTINNWRQISNSEVQQVKTTTITAASSALNSIWTATLTTDTGATETVTYTEDGSPTLTEIAAGLTAAWNLSLKPHIAGITAANPSAGVITFTADTSGIPFSIAVTNASDGTSSSVSTTANVGNNDYNTAANWQLNAVPVATNDVRFGVGSAAAKYGLDQSGVSLAAFYVLPGCGSQFGLFDNGVGSYLKLATSIFRYEGSGQLGLFDLGSSAISPYIAASGNAQAGLHTIYVKGSALATLYINRGNVGIAELDGDTATITALDIGYLTNLPTDANVTIGAGTTLTTLNQGGGYCLAKCGMTTGNIGLGSTLKTDLSGAITTLNVYGNAILNSTGTITTLNVYGGVVDLTQNRAVRTITTINLYNGARVKTGSWITHTNKPWFAEAGAATLEYVG